MADLADAAQAPDRWFLLPTGGLLYGDGTGGVTVGGLSAWQDCPERTAALSALGVWCRETVAALRAALAAGPPTPTHEARRLLDEFDRYASTPGGPDYSGSPFEAEVRAFLAGAPPDDEPAEAEQLRRLVKLHAGAHQLCGEAFIHMGEAVITKIADGGTLAEVLDLVGDCMNERDAVDEACEALFDRARAAAGSPPPTPDDPPSLDDLQTMVRRYLHAERDGRFSPTAVRLREQLAAWAGGSPLRDDEWTEVAPDWAAQVCDRAHASPHADEAGHAEGFCLACAEIRAALSAGPPPTNGPTRQDEAFSERFAAMAERLLSGYIPDPFRRVGAINELIPEVLALASHRPDNDPLVPGLENVRASAEPVCGDQYHRHVGSCYLYQAPDNDPAGPTVPEVTGDGTGHALPPFDPRATRARTDQVDVTPGKDHPTGDDDG